MIGFAVKGIGATLLFLAKNPLIAAAIGIGAGVKDTCPLNNLNLMLMLMNQ